MHWSSNHDLLEEKMNELIRQVSPTDTAGTKEMRTFEGGATRQADDDKLDFEGFLSPLSIERYAQYLHEHRVQADGAVRASDNWQKGMPLAAYMKSLWRHFHAVWKGHRGWNSSTNIEDDLCAIIFNAQGYLHELLKQKESRR